MEEKYAMTTEQSLVIYRNHPALVSGREGDKINITIYGEVKAAGSVKAREKDIELIHPGPCTLQDLEIPLPEGNIQEVWELLLENNNAESTLKELAELVFGLYSPKTALAAWELLAEGLYFSGNVRSIKARPREFVEADEKKRAEKKRETEDRDVFLEKFKKLPPFRGSPPGKTGEAIDLTDIDRHFLQDVEALARGQSDKSRTLKELGKSETPEEAHRFLLAAGAWTVWENPHPGRFGLKRDSAKTIPNSPPEEERLDLTGLTSYAIDNPWSDDPDDAVSLETCSDGSQCLWVHVADPAASVTPGSPADIEARGRGATLYLPEGPSRMLCPEALPLFALGLSDVSLALSFKITLKQDLTISTVEIVPSRVRVTRLSYSEADSLIEKGGKDGETLAALAMLAERNMERRLDTGAVVIELPETRIHVELGQEKRVSVEPVIQYRSMGLVRECMLLAGEGTARWALQRQLPFPFISQEAGELPKQRLAGLAGAWQLRRCMRPRVLSSKPAIHWGLGLDEYTQVTSPLRRYTDLLCHQQIRSFILGQKPLEEEEIILRASAAEAAASAAGRVEKVSRSHWLAVYMLNMKNFVLADTNNPDTGGNGISWEGVVLDRKGSRGMVLIPDLGVETQISLRGSEKPNEKVCLGLSSVRIPEGELGFILVG